MGTQQILLIVLSVIIVGIAMAVGITMFTAQAKNANRTAVISDMDNFASSALQYYNTDVAHAGGGNAWPATVDELGVWIGYDYDKTNDTITTDNGTYVLSIAADVLTMVGSGTRKGNDKTNPVQATMKVTGATSGIATTIQN